MVIDGSYIDGLRRNRIEIPEELEEILIDRLGEEPTPYTYSEHDITEQSRKLIQKYWTPQGRLELKYGVDKLQNRLEMLQSQIQRELSDGVVDF